MTTLPKVQLYTDGACSGNPGPGGWGVYMIYGTHTKKLYGYELDTTNNRMELLAAINGIDAIKKQCDIDLYTDSVYLKNGITTWIHTWVKNNWRTSNKGLVKNIDLWQTLLISVAKHNVEWHWVKGHSDNIGNQIADELAVLGCSDAKLYLKNLDKKKNNDMHQ